MSPPEPEIKVFISYAHADQELHRKLEEHLSSLKHTGEITIWQDQEIPLGTNWEDQILTHLNEADLILLLISASFIASNYCWNREVEIALERHKAGTARVIPVLLKPALWQNTPLGQIQALPTGAKPITQWNDQEAAFEDIARGIQSTAKHMRRTFQSSVSSNLPQAIWDNSTESTQEPAISHFLKALILPLRHVFAHGHLGTVSAEPQQLKTDRKNDANKSLAISAGQTHKRVSPHDFISSQDVDDNSLQAQQVTGISEVDNVLDIDLAESLPRSIWPYIPLIVFPVLFLGIASLLILPPIAAHQPPMAVWFIAIVLLLIALGQGVAVYFAGSHHRMWLLGTVGGLLLFVLFGVFVLVSLGAGLLLLLVILIGCIYSARRCIYPVGEGFVGIVFVGRKYTRTLFPGFNLIWPWEQITHQVNIEETHWYCPPQRIQLSPEEDVVLRAVISYEVLPEDAYIAVTRVNNWEESLQGLFVTTLQTLATHFVPADFLAWPHGLQAYRAQSQHEAQLYDLHLPNEDADDFSGGLARRERINILLFQQMRDRVALWGIQIHWVRIRDIELMPHTLARISAPPVMADYTYRTPS